MAQTASAEYPSTVVPPAPAVAAAATAETLWKRTKAELAELAKSTTSSDIQKNSTDLKGILDELKTKLEAEINAWNLSTLTELVSSVTQKDFEEYFTARSTHSTMGESLPTPAFIQSSLVLTVLSAFQSSQYRVEWEGGTTLRVETDGGEKNDETAKKLTTALQNLITQNPHLFSAESIARAYTMAVVDPSPGRVIAGHDSPLNKAATAWEYATALREKEKISPDQKKWLYLHDQWLITDKNSSPADIRDDYNKVVSLGEMLSGKSGTKEWQVEEEQAAKAAVTLVAQATTVTNDTHATTPNPSTASNSTPENHTTPSSTGLKATGNVAIDTIAAWLWNSVENLQTGFWAILGTLTKAWEKWGHMGLGIGLISVIYGLFVTIPKLWIPVWKALLGGAFAAGAVEAVWETGLPGLQKAMSNWDQELHQKFINTQPWDIKNKYTAASNRVASANDTVLGFTAFWSMPSFDDTKPQKEIWAIRWQDRYTYLNAILSHPEVFTWEILTNSSTWLNSNSQSALGGVEMKDKNGNPLNPMIMRNILKVYLGATVNPDNTIAPVEYSSLAWENVKEMIEQGSGVASQAAPQQAAPAPAAAPAAPAQAAPVAIDSAPPLPSRQ